MINIYDIAYFLSGLASAPIWLAHPGARRKVFKALRERMGDYRPRTGDGPAVMIHAVSVGELNAARAMVRALAEARPDLRFIISTSTDTGFARGRELYGADDRVTLIRYPLDFTNAVNRVLDAARPDLVVLMELEVWPNFVRQCQRRGIPVVLVNGRLTAGSFRRYRIAGQFVRRTFRRLAFVGAQEETYAQRFIALGVPQARVQVTGTMKWDTAQVSGAVEAVADLAASVGLLPGQQPIWVCGSTGPGEEELLLGCYRQLLVTFPNLRLVIVPRKPERFDEVAELIRNEGFDLVRRSQSQIAIRNSQIPVVLGDTMGELRKFYELADVAFVGRTLKDLGPRQHGSDMIEPAALAKSVIVGPYTGNFAEVMNRFRSSDAIREVPTIEELTVQVSNLLANRHEASALGQRAQEVVRRCQGTTALHVAVILKELQSVLAQRGVSSQETVTVASLPSRG